MMNTNTEVPVQMVMPELNAGQPMQNENNSSSTQSATVMHSTMSMAQSPLQQQMQAIQQNLNSNAAGSMQMVMSELNTQVQVVQNENINHSCSNTQTTLMHPTATMPQASVQHVQVIPQLPQHMSTSYFQSVYPQTGNTLTQAGYILPANFTLNTGTTSMVQNIAQSPNVQLQAKPEFNKVPTPAYIVAKPFQTQNLITKTMHSNAVPVNSQVSNANQIKQMTSQPQVITTQASSGAVYQPQPQIFALNNIQQLPNISWATPAGTTAYQQQILPNAIQIVRSQQQPEHPVYIQSSQTGMPMYITAGTQLSPGITALFVQQQPKSQQITPKHQSFSQGQVQKTASKMRNISPSVATQTNTGEKIAIPRTRVNQHIIRAKGKNVPIHYNNAATLSTILPQVTTDIQNPIQLVQVDPPNQLDATNQTLPNITKSTASIGTDFPVVHNQIVNSVITQTVQNLPSKTDVISTPTSAQITNSVVGKPVAMVTASTVNTTLTVNSVVSSPTIVTSISAPVVSSVETPVSVPPCPPVSCSLPNDTNVSDSTLSSLPLPETNNVNEENVSTILPVAEANICEANVTDNLKSDFITSDQTAVSKSETVKKPTELRNIEIVKPQIQVNTIKTKSVKLLKLQTCNSEQQTIVSVTKTTPVNFQKKIDNLKCETHINNSKFTTNILKSDKEAKTNVHTSDVLMPETPVSDGVQSKNNCNKENTEYKLDIVIKKEPIDSPAKAENESNFKPVAQKEVIIKQADSSGTVQNEFDKHHSDNQHNIQNGAIQRLFNAALTVEKNFTSETDAKNIAVEPEINSVSIEKKSIKNSTSDSVNLESKTSMSEIYENKKAETDLKVCEKKPVELIISNEIGKKECDGHFFKNFKNELIVPEAFSEVPNDSVPQNAMSSPCTLGKQKQRLKAVVRPHILTHVIDGFVIYESSEPFPVNKSALMSDSCTPIVPKIADNSKKHKGSKHLSIKNPDEPTKPDDLKEPNEPTKTDFPKKRSDRIKLMETQKQLDLKKSEPKKSNDSKKSIEPKTPTEKKAPVDLKKTDEPKKSEDSKKIESNAVSDTLSLTDPRKSNQAITEIIPKTPGKRGRKRKELRNKRGRKKLIPDTELNKSNIEIIVIEDNAQESDTVEDESSCAIEASPLPVQTADKEAHKSIIQTDEKLPIKTVVSEETNNVEANEIKTFSDKLPTEWSVNDVCDFVRSIPTFQESAEFFEKQEIDGKALLLLKVDHIVQFTNLKFGPALKLISFIDDMKEKYSLEV